MRNLVASLIAASLAAAAPAPAPAPAPVPSWTVVQAKSQLGFSASMNGAGFSGRFARWTARIRFDPRALDRSSVVVVVDTRSARTGDQTRDEALPGADWFSSATYPTAIFRSTKIRSAGANRYVADGRLTLRGTERPVALGFTLAIAGDTARMSGSATIDRHAFGVGSGQFADDETVAASVKILPQLVARSAQ